VALKRKNSFLSAFTVDVKKGDTANIRSLALEHVVGLYLANATKNANPAKSFVDMDKSVSDLVADSRHIVDYLKGLVD